RGAGGVAGAATPFPAPADPAVAGAHVPAVEPLVGRPAADRHADEIETLDDVLELRGLAAGDRDTGLARALAQADADGIEHGGVGALDRDVVDQRQRLGPDAEPVLAVHRAPIRCHVVVLGPPCPPPCALP